MSFEEEDPSAANENLQEQRDEILALQSIYNTEDDEKLKIISEVNQDGQGSFSILDTGLDCKTTSIQLELLSWFCQYIQVSVCVKPVCDQIQVRVVIPNEEKDEELLGATAMPEIRKDAPILPQNVKMSRSISGQKWEGSFPVKYLSPLHMYITFPASYPSHNPPEYHITCGWLTTIQIQTLSSVLDRLWPEAYAMPVVFTWIDWLENNTLDHLGITDHLAIHSCNPEESLMRDESSSMDMLLPWQEEIGDIVASLIQYNRELVEIEFCQNQHLCEVCYDEKHGTQFFQLHECGHKFCHECMMAFCELHVRNGTVEELRCPDTECDSLLPPYIVQAVLDPAAYERWEKLLLQKTLDSMGDTIYCPRCQSLVIKEKEEHLQLAHCTVCYFSFCTQCNMCWHQGSSCENDDDKLESVKKKRSTLSPEEQKKYDEMVQKLEMEIASKKEMKKNTRNCPKCKIPVEKTGGCNKMTCKCQTSFCWICGAAINGYCHFRNGKCALFPGQLVDANEMMARRRMPPGAVIRIRAIIAVNPLMENQQARCPMCKQVNLKSDRNNHIKCWNCKVNFCFLCTARIIGSVTVHFRGPCVQHS